MNTCDTCEFWDKKIPNGNLDQRACFCHKLNQSIDSDGVSVDDAYGVIETGPKFGCVHHTPKQ